MPEIPWHWGAAAIKKMGLPAVFAAAVASAQLEYQAIFSSAPTLTVRINIKMNHLIPQK